MENLLRLAEYIQNEIDDIENQIANLQAPKKPYTIKPRLNPMQEYTDAEFRKRFRLTKRSVNYLHSLIGEDLEPKTSRDEFTLSAIDKILITLRYYASASFHLVSADFYGVSESTVCRIVPIVTDKIASLSQRFIHMPVTNDELAQKKREFFRIAGMPGIIGAIDGTLVKIQEVGGNVNKTLFLNSNIFERFLNGEFKRNGVESLLLGDGGYGFEQFLAVPLREVNRERTPAENLYQRAHISTRNVVERFNGQWKKRFPCLWVGMRFRKLETVLNVIVATAVLHNLCQIHGDNEPPPLSPNEEGAYNRALRLEREIILNMQQQRNTNRQPGSIVNTTLRNYFEQQAQ